MPAKKTTPAKKTAVPIPKPGGKSVDPAIAIKKALEAKFAAASSAATTACAAAVDAKIANH